MKAPLQIKVLGELAVVRDAQEIVLPASKKTRALLAYLALANRRQRRDYLCQLLWNVPDDPRASLRWSLTKLRRVFNEDADEPCLRTDGSSVFLDANKLDVDLLRVAHITSKNVRSLTTSDLEILAALFRGRFLEGLELPRCPVFEAWRTFQVDALDRTRSLILQMLVERLRGEPERALPFAQALQSMDPTDEQVSLELRSLDTSARESAMRAASARLDRPSGGLPDWNARDLSFAAMVCDLESVADANSLNGFPLLGVSQSCAVSVAYAVRHPERVSHLILYGGYAKGWRKRGDRHEIDTHEAMTTLIREGWGKDNPAFRQLFTETFIPGASREQMAWFNDLQKETASPDNASRLHYSFGDMDVSDILGDVSVPTLVLHARNDAAVPFEQGKALAAGIPGARFVDLNSANHMLLSEEPAFADFVREVRSFISAADPK